MLVHSSSRTTVASTFSRGSPVRARSASTRARIRGSTSTEGDHAAELGLVPHLAPPGVIAVLLAPPGVPAGGLEMAVGRGADPHIGVGRRDRELSDPLQRLLVGDPLPVLADVGEPGARALAADPRARVADVAQARLGGGLVGRRRCGRDLGAATSGIKAWSRTLAATCGRHRQRYRSQSPDSTAVTMPVVRPGSRPPGVRRRPGGAVAPDALECPRPAASSYPRPASSTRVPNHTNRDPYALLCINFQPWSALPAEPPIGYFPRGSSPNEADRDRASGTPVALGAPGGLQLRPPERHGAQVRQPVRSR